ncbi:FMN-dependent NADH-azoreductase [Streptomyces sp. NPDC091972]|uniref:FMN-dependent NADH-azoreductase n=1 Tax=Streptomyces sp. NPDC091972 TaxID=3366007 RepID=UPI00380CC8CE
MRILHVQASPRTGRSASLEVASAFLDAWASRDPDVVVDTLDVWNTPLPELDGPALEAKYAGISGRSRTPEQEETWQAIGLLADRLKQAELLIFSVPMWNFGIPYRLKHLIDAISQKDMLFAFDGSSISGHLSGRSAVIISARGSSFGEEFASAEYDFQQRYLRAWLHMLGLTNVHTVEVEKTFQGGEVDAASRSAARQRVRALALTLVAQSLGSRPSPTLLA